MKKQEKISLWDAANTDPEDGLIVRATSMGSIVSERRTPQIYEVRHYAEPAATAEVDDEEEGPMLIGTKYMFDVWAVLGTSNVQLGTYVFVLNEEDDEADDGDQYDLYSTTDIDIVLDEYSFEELVAAQWKDRTQDPRHIKWCAMMERHYAKSQADVMRMRGYAA